MPKVGVEQKRKAQLIEAAIATIGELGLGGASLQMIAGRAGLSTGLVAHYFRDKNGLLEATLRHIMDQLGTEAVSRYKKARGPRARLKAIVDANLSYQQLDSEFGAVWLAFWAESLHSDRLYRVQRVNHHRLLSNLRHCLRDLVASAEVDRIAESIACLIDGVWLRSTLVGGDSHSRRSRALVMEAVDALLDSAELGNAKPGESP